MAAEHLSTQPGRQGLARAIAPSAALVLALAAAPARAASFPCEAARSPVEKLVCQSPEASELDEYLGRYHAAARDRLAHAEACLVADQRAWLRSTRDTCQDAACLKRVYLARLAVLDGLQPGVTRLRGVTLPRAPVLVWIVPPAADQVAAPRNRATTPLAATGRLVDEVASGDGHVLRTDAGARHLVVPLMFLGPPTSEALAGLAREPSARYELRGRADALGANAAFSTGHCTFVYRIPP